MGAIYTYARARHKTHDFPNSYRNRLWLEVPRVLFECLGYWAISLPLSYCKILSVNLPLASASYRRYNQTSSGMTPNAITDVDFLLLQIQTDGGIDCFRLPS
jgi:hypothetical protein